MKPRTVASLQIPIGRRVVRIVRILPLLAALVTLSCLSPSDRIAGSSTEAGNAGGKLSLVDGTPAAGVSVSLVSRGYLPDTLASGRTGNRHGSYYRTRTGPDGRFLFSDVSPGSYRVMAVDATLGASIDSIPVYPGAETSFIDQVLKPLGGIRGIAQIVGSATTQSHVWITPKATLAQPPLADTYGAFRLDSLPEGVYELFPQCFSCRPVSQGYRVTVKAGIVTYLDDTLKLYPEYFFGFPDSGDLFIRSSWLPVPIGGKINRGDEYQLRPASVAWTWNGRPVMGTDIHTPEGVSETWVAVDSGWFGQDTSGLLKLVLRYPDTTIAREWHVFLDPDVRIWPLSAVAVTCAVKIPGPADRTLYRFRVTGSQPLDSSAAAFWKLWPGAKPNADTDTVTDTLPEWIELEARESDMLALGGLDTARFTFFLVPDSVTGGRVFRPRKDERLVDIPKLRYLERARFGFTDPMEPWMRPEGLIMDRGRGSLIAQRYRVDSTGSVEEILGEMSPQGQATVWPPGAGTPLLVYRSGRAAAGFSWEKPLRDAATLLAVTREGLAVRLDATRISVRVSAAQLDSLLLILEPLAVGASALADSGRVGATGTLEYVLTRGCGLLWVSGSRATADGLASDIRDWMIRNGLDEGVRIPLAAGAFSWLGFESGPGGIRYTGDTLTAEFADSAGGAVVTERLTKGSSGWAGDSAAIRYFLVLAGDSLSGSADPGVVSRLFGKLDESRGLIPLSGLLTVAPVFVDGVPVLIGGGNTLSGRLADSLEIADRVISRPALFLDGRAIDAGKQGQGFLYTPEGGLERAWRFGGRAGAVTGWDRR